MIKVCYSEQDTPSGPALRLEACGHAGYAPKGQDVVCAGASCLMQALVSLLAGEENARADVWDEPDGPRLAVKAGAPVEPWISGAFELAKAGFALLAERYPENLRFADTSRRGEQAMIDLQLFAEGGDGGGESGESAAPALSRAQAQQAAASGTLKAPAAAETQTAPEAGAEEEPPEESEEPEEGTEAPQPRNLKQPPIPPRQMGAVRALHARWAAEEAAMRQSVPEFSLQKELQNPEMRRLMLLPGMRVQDAYRLAHYSETMSRTARAVEQGVLERIRQRSARPPENGVNPSGAAAVRPDVANMTRAQREALEREALHGKQIKL